MHLYRDLKNWLTRLVIQIYKNNCVIKYLTRLITLKLFKFIVGRFTGLINKPVKSQKPTQLKQLFLFSNISYT